MPHARVYSHWPALLIIFASALVACSGNKANVTPPPAAKDPARLIQLLEKDVSMARRDQVNILSPTLFDQAESLLIEARRMLASGQKPNAIVDRIERSQAYLLKARDNSQISRSVLAEVIKNRASARQAGAPSLSRDYAQVEERFSLLTRAIEKNNVRYARSNSQSVADAYRELEIKAIKVQTLGQVRQLLEIADSQKTFKLAPQTYARAREKLQTAEQFITANPYRKTEMLELANEALFEAERHLEIAQFSSRLEPMAPEQIALLIEDILLQISDKLTAPDMRDNSVQIQVNNILGTIDSQRQDRRFATEKEENYQKQIDALQQELAKADGTRKKEKQLSAAESRRFKQAAQKVKSLFDPSEADVYVEDLRVIIRLKSMRFPVGKSVILPENYALLGKVQQAVGLLADVDIIIEGHTDSTGSEGINELISEQRADAVRHYLVVEKNLSYDRIIAVGYGSMRPLAPNTSKKGRAMNRRIDLIISPHF